MMLNHFWCMPAQNAAKEMSSLATGLLASVCACDYLLSMIYPCIKTNTARKKSRHTSFMMDKLLSMNVRELRNFYNSTTLHWVKDLGIYYLLLQHFDFKDLFLASSWCFLTVAQDLMPCFVGRNINWDWIGPAFVSLSDHPALNYANDGMANRL
jgi:hypothetical protein